MTKPTVFLHFDSYEKVDQSLTENTVLLTDWSLGRLGFRGDAELSGAGLVFGRHPEDVSHSLQKTFNVQLGARDDVPEDIQKTSRNI